MKTLFVIMILVVCGCSQPKPESPFEKRERLHEQHINYAIIEYLRHPDWTMNEVMAEVEYREYLTSKE